MTTGRESRKSTGDGLQSKKIIAHPGLVNHAPENVKNPANNSLTEISATRACLGDENAEIAQESNLAADRNCKISIRSSTRNVHAPMDTEVLHPKRASSGSAVVPQLPFPFCTNV